MFDQLVKNNYLVIHVVDVAGKKETTFNDNIGTLTSARYTAWN